MMDAPELNNNWPIIDKPERDREKVQLRLTTRLFQMAVSHLLPVKLDKKILVTYLKVCELASVFETFIHNDSIFAVSHSGALPYPMPMDVLLANIREGLERLPTTPEMSEDFYREVLKRFQNVTIRKVTKDIVINIDLVCDYVWQSQEKEERCRIQLEEAQSAVQRAVLLLEMGRESDAFFEFQNIIPEETYNIDNLLDMVELVRRFESKQSAKRVLKRWFAFQVSLHSLTFELIGDILFSGISSTRSIRQKYIRKILLGAASQPVDVVIDNMALILPANLNFPLKPKEIHRRLKVFGITPPRVGLRSVYGSDAICLYTLLTEICMQLNNLARLAIQTNDKKLALFSLERCILTSFILILLPPREEDIHHVFGYGSYNLCHEWVIENLKESAKLLDSFRMKSPPDNSVLRYLRRLLRNFQGVVEKLENRQVNINQNY